ncbi:hypothetical protein RN001_010970 [Aquatica leii]|uniref:Kinesin-like protein n=1 Tax=Aquatica leii TaxID=1421715 RepID=A0AAN7PVG3_9COLE|nr:hypothetical protein RN001_010970 [Aquatica leii]
MAENVKVIVRCRPMNQREIELKCKCIVQMKNCMTEIWDPREGPSFPKQFTFDSVYDQESYTENIYNDICYPLIESVLEGYNSTIFVYGQTGCGKSFSMEGTKSGNSPEKGIISRAFEHIFEAISVTSGVKYLALVSYLEIYNEQIRDLLLPNEASLNLKEVPNEGVTVPGLTIHPVHNVAECEEMLNIGSKHRMIGATLMNQVSSRSHSIFTISIEQISNDNETIRKGKLNLVDLAGSERQAKTGATGDRLKEATKINLSLSALGNVISALVDGKAKHIPYRDSKLTRLLQDSLGGNTRTLMIACISPASRDYDETLSTLRYANRAKNIHNKPRINEDPKDAMLRQYQEEIVHLRNLLENRLNTPLKIEDISDEVFEINKNVIDSKRDLLIQEYQEEMTKLKNLHENEKSEKEIILKQIESIKKEYQIHLEQLNQEMEERKPKSTSKEEILNRIETLKASMIGGEKADDKELSERRKRKKLASEKRLSAIAHVLAKIDMNEDRELLQNQYKDISQELNIKTDALRRYRHKVKSLEKEIDDIQGEFQVERNDYLETIRKLNRNTKLWSQIADKVCGTLKNECNYRNLDAIKEQAIWIEDSQRYKLPNLVIHRTKLPPPGRDHSGHSEKSSNPSTPPDENIEKMEQVGNDDIIGSYFKPRRAIELLNQTSRLDSSVFNAKPKSSDGGSPVLSNSFGCSHSNWVTGSSLMVDGNNRRPLRLEALPMIEKRRKNTSLILPWT